MHTPHVLSGGRYPVLRALAIIYVIAAALAVITTLIAVGYLLFGVELAWADRLIMSVAALTAGVFLVLSMLAIAEVLKLAIDVEHNTRITAVANRAGAMSAAGAMTSADASVASGDGAAVAARGNRLDALDDETAEAALLRGH
jgi:hypothetical protein